MIAIVMLAGWVAVVASVTLVLTVGEWLGAMVSENMAEGERHALKGYLGSL
jgi:hypothetical protein